MKSFSQFLKEEIDLKGSQGIPDDFMSDAERQATINLGVRKDDSSQEMQYGSQIMRLISNSQQLISRGLNPQELEERLQKIESLAKRIVLAEYGEILEASEKPVELDIKLVRMGEVSKEIPKIKDVPSKPQDVVAFEDEETRQAVEKKKLLNLLNQGYAKATKDIIKYSDLVEDGLKDIFGNNWEVILTIWLTTTELANKMDWIIPIDAKSVMMKNAPEGMAGAVQLEWKKDEDDDEEGETQSEEDREDFDKIVIKAVGIDFPMLLHEAIKGIYQLLQSGAIKDDSEIAEIVKMNTSSFEDESQDFRYGVAAQGMYRDFINNCKDSNKYSNMDARVYAQLALDKDRGGKFTDGEFLEITKSIFSCFDLKEEGDKLEFTINVDKFESSTAKVKIEGIISDIVDAEKEYEKQLAEWEMEQQFLDDESKYQDTEEEEDSLSGLLSDIGIDSTVEEEEEEVDYSKLKQSELQKVIDDALDRGDYEEVKIASQYLKEGKEIFLKEVERLIEMKKYRK